MTNKEEVVCKNCGYSSEINPDGTCWSSVCKGEYINKFEITTMEKLKSAFEANMLDGDKLEDCGKSMLSAQSVFDFFWNEIEEIRKSDMERVERELNSMSYAGVLDSNEKRRGYDIAIQEVLSIIKQAHDTN